MTRKFKNANAAFSYLFNKLNVDGVVYESRFGKVKKIMNIGFKIENPKDNLIIEKYRGWNNKYAEREFKWYLSEERDVRGLAEYAPIWNNMHSGDGIVNSNYGWQWNRNNQLNEVIKELRKDKQSRRAAISIYDGKEKDQYELDTPCTYAIQFYVIKDKLSMTVMMRSNDLWYGFCNDQYCFSKLQEIVANKLNLEVGTYYHFAVDMHLYEDQWIKPIKKTVKVKIHKNKQYYNLPFLFKDANNFMLKHNLLIDGNDIDSTYDIHMYCKPSFKENGCAYIRVEDLQQMINNKK